MSREDNELSRTFLQCFVWCEGSCHDQAYCDQQLTTKNNSFSSVLISISSLFISFPELPSLGWQDHTFLGFFLNPSALSQTLLSPPPCLGLKCGYSPRLGPQSFGCHLTLTSHFLPAQTPKLIICSPDLLSPALHIQLPDGNIILDVCIPHLQN